MEPPYSDNSEKRFWSTGVRARLNKKRTLELKSLLNCIETSDVICSVGSCFAQHIGKNLLDRGFKFLQSSFSDNRIESFGIGNVYTPKQLLQWLEVCVEERIWTELTFFETNNYLFHDYLLPQAKPAALDSLRFKRDLICKEIVANLKQSQTLIFTLGLPLGKTLFSVIIV